MGMCSVMLVLVAVVVVGVLGTAGATAAALGGAAGLRRPLRSFDLHPPARRYTNGT
jgi:hypothetical protein